MSGTYLALIGGNNVLSILDTAPADILPATVNGATLEGRTGSLRTSLLVALMGAATDTIPTPATANLFAVTVACPAGFSAPAALSEVGFDYSQLLPTVSAQIVCSGFDVVAPAVWPATPAALLNEMVSNPANLVSLNATLVDVGIVSTNLPYGSLTYLVAGSATVAAVSKALISLTIDFGSSIVS